MKGHEMVGCRLARASAALTLVCLAGTALADLPPALDRAPKGAAITIAIRDIQKARANVERMLKTFDEGAADGLSMLDAVTEADGFNKNGSAAVVMLGDPAKEDFGDENVALILPIADWGKFVEGMGGDKGKKQTSLPNLDGGVMARDLGGGYAVVGMEEILGGFKDAAGQIAEHKALLGATGVSVADSADVVAIVNVQMFKTQIDQGIEEGKNQMDMMAGMMAAANPGAEEQFAALFKGLEDAARNAQSLVVGMSAVGGNALAMDLAVHFKDGTESGKRFTHSGGLSSSVLGAMPAMPFLTAFAVDTAHPFIRGLMAEGAKAQAKNPNPLAGMNAANPAMLEKLDAVGFFLGSNPALLSTGLFAKALTFQQGKDPAGLLAEQRKTMQGMKGEQEGIKVDSTFTPDAVEIAGQKVDRLKATIEIDPDSPMAQAQQFMTLFTGTSGDVNIMSTATKMGVLTAMSANTELMTKAIEAQNGKGNLATNDDFKAVAAALPENRAFEGYLGVKGLADTIGGVLQLFGQPMPVEIKDELPPIGLGVTATTGGLRARLVLPEKVMSTFAEVAKKMNEMQEGEPMEGEDQPEAQPGERRKPRL
jgi:hypothetical protein